MLENSKQKIPRSISLIWQIGGANSELLMQSPSHERIKFLTIAVMNILIALITSSLASIHASRWVERFFSYDFAWAIAVIVAFFVLVVVLVLLVSGIRTIVRSGSSSHILIPSNFVALLITLTLGWLIGYMVLMLAENQDSSKLIYQNQLAVFVVFAFCLIATLTPTLTAWMWSSPKYNALLKFYSEEVEFVTEQSLKSIDEPTGPSESDLRLENELQKILDDNPVNTDIARRLIELRIRMNKLEEAANIYDMLISQNPRNERLIREQAELYMKIGDERRYVRTLEHADLIKSEASFEANIGKSIELSRLETKDLEFFGNFEWNFQSQVNVLLGKNGYGKSYLLRALVAMLQNEERLTGEFLENSGPKAMMQVDIDREGQCVSAVRRRIVFDKTFGKVPVLAIPDIRYINKARSSFSPPADVTDLRSQSAKHFLNEEPYEGLVLNFLYELCLDYNNKTSFDQPLFRLIQDAVAKLSDTDFKFHDIKRVDNARFQILVLTEGNESRPLPLQKASQGTLSVVAMLGLIYRYLHKIYPQVPEDELLQQRAIVVIDEIDAHLHPSWQQKILQLFRDTFPNVQFILTAHSPLVVAGCKEFEVAVLTKNDSKFVVDVLEQHFIGATTEDMYQQIFDVEETDTTYLRLNTLQGSKQSLLEKTAKLEKKKEISTAEKKELQELKGQLYYLGQFEDVRAQRESETRLEDENRELRMEASQLRGELSELKKKQKQYERGVSDDGVSAGGQFIQDILSNNPSNQEVVEKLSMFLAGQGRYQESIIGLETLHDFNPDNVDYLRELAVQYQTLGDYSKATDVVKKALVLQPDDQQFQTVLQKLQQVSKT